MTEQELCTKAEELVQYVLPQAIKPWTVHVCIIPIRQEGTEDKFLVDAYSGRFHIRTELTRTAIESMSRETLESPALVTYEAEIHVEQPILLPEIPR